MKKTKQEIQAKIDKWQKELDNYKERLEVGKWYKLSDAEIANDYGYKGVLFCFKGYGSVNYGFGRANNNYLNNYCAHEYRDYVPATDKEVEQALIKEAKRRGFKEGVSIKYLSGTTNTSGRFNRLRLHRGALIDNQSAIIFERGFWAEIEDKTPVINGYKMEVDGDYVKFGCKEFKISYVKKLYKWVYAAGIDGIVIKEPSTTYNIDISDLKEVVDCLNK